MMMAAAAGGAGGPAAAEGLWVIPVGVDGPVGAGDDLASVIAGAAELRDGDAVVVSQKAVSRQEGRIVQLASVEPSLLAEGIASAYGRDPRIVELVLSESKRIVRMARGIMITETRHGIVCANAGVDESNMGPGEAALLPGDPDASARRLRLRLAELTGRSVAVLVSDTFGRPFRMGQTDCAIGVSGMGAVTDHRGAVDAAGRGMRITQIATADEVCAAAELVRGKTAGRPAAVVRGLGILPGGGGGNGGNDGNGGNGGNDGNGGDVDDTARGLLRPGGEDLFR